VEIHVSLHVIQEVEWRYTSRCTPHTTGALIEKRTFPTCFDQYLQLVGVDVPTGQHLTDPVLPLTITHKHGP